MCGTSRGYIWEMKRCPIPRGCEGIACINCVCGGTHSKSGFCLRCGRENNV